jgi:hypothetical protein
MISKKKAKKPTPAKQAKKPAKQAAKKNKKSTRTKGSKHMDSFPQAQNPSQAPSCIEALLEAINNKLGELVQIETYLANKVTAAASPPVVPVAVPTCAAALAPASIAAAPAPAQTAAPSAPATRPGAGTVGCLVWDYCDGMTTQLGRAPTKDEVIAAIKAYSPTLNGQPVNELTASTQYSKWRGAQGLPRLPRGFGAQKPAAAPADVAAAPTPAPVAPPVAAAPAFAPLPLPAAVPPAPAPAPAPVAAPSLPPWLRAQG